MIKRWMMLAVLAAMLAWAVQMAGAQEKSVAKAPAKTASWTGEIVDMSCYTANGATGEKHGHECGAKCVANGTPMGLLTSNGKVMLLVLDHDNADPYNACKAWVGDKVEVTGTMASRGGINAIDVTASKPAAAAAK
jgi:hypothetical protein